jgi:hypothetical protein
MGNNSAFTAMEHAVVNCYKRGKLDKPLLKCLLEPYRDMDIDSGGKEGLFVREDGRRLEVEDIVIKVMTGKLPLPYPKLPKNHDKWTDAQRQLNDDWQEKRYDAFNKITDRFGWC